MSETRPPTFHDQQQQSPPPVEYLLVMLLCFCVRQLCGTLLASCTTIPHKQQMSLLKTTVNETLKWLSALPILLQNCCGGDCSIGIVNPPTTFWYLSCHQYLSMDNAVLNKYSELFRTGRFKYLKQLAFTKHVLFSPVGRRDLSTVKNLRLRVLF